MSFDDEHPLGVPKKLNPLARRFFTRPALVVAKELLGCLLVHETESGRVVGRIVETEAYAVDDPGCHAFRGRTPRNDPMFGKPGTAYVYFTYGMHWMLNAVCERVDVPAAVLIRAVQPLDGIELMRERRGSIKDRDLCRGPGRLAQAFGINASQNRSDLVKPPLFIAAGERLPEEAVETSPRVGLGAAQDGREWRFFERGSMWVSRFIR
jgi:DNA-3-methyladenine glycosylase